MGWSGTDTGSLTRKELQDYLDKHFSWGKCEVVKSSLVGTTYYAAVRTIADGQVWGLVVLTHMRAGMLYYKDMSEGCGPCEDDCPVGILNMLSPTESECANAWRQRCRQKHARRQQARKLSRNSLKGYAVSTSRGYIRKLTCAHIFFSCLIEKVWATKEDAEKVLAAITEENAVLLRPVVREVTRATTADCWI